MFASVEEWLYNIQMSILTQNEIVFRLAVAIGLGMLIGLERILVHKEAGMKTHALVSLGSAIFIVISEMISLKYPGVAGFDPTRIASQIIVGIGFLGAGSIILQGNKLFGLTTASGLWVTAGVGMAAGFGFITLATIATGFVLFILVVVYFLEKPLRKISNEMDQPRIQ